MVTLTDIIHPHTETKFLNNIFGNTFMHLPGHAGKFAQLMSWADLNALLSYAPIHQGRITVWKDGKQVHWSAFMEEKYGVRDHRDNRSQLMVRELTQHLRDGGTLNIDSVDWLHAHVREIAEDLERRLRFRVNINLYAGWGQSYGFETHTDDHDVLVLQVHGRKTWEIYERLPEIPLTGEAKAFPDEELGRPLWTAVVGEGDALYIPRGTPHRATPCGEPVLHLTIGLYPYIGMNLLAWIADKLVPHPVMRSNLPLFREGELQSEYLQHFVSAIAGCLDDASVLDDFMREQDGKARARSKFSLPWSATEEILPDTDLYRIHIAASRPLQIAPAGQDGGAAVDVSCDGKVFTFPQETVELFNYLIARSPVTEKEFIAACQSAQDGEQLREFVRELVRLGLAFVTLDGSTHSAVSRNVA